METTPPCNELWHYAAQSSQKVGKQRCNSSRSSLPGKEGAHFEVDSSVSPSPKVVYQSEKSGSGGSHTGRGSGSGGSNGHMASTSASGGGRHKSSGSGSGNSWQISGQVSGSGSGNSHTGSGSGSGGRHTGSDRTNVRAARPIGNRAGHVPETQFSGGEAVSRCGGRSSTGGDTGSGSGGDGGSGSGGGSGGNVADVSSSGNDADSSGSEQQSSGNEGNAVPTIGTEYAKHLSGFEHAAGTSQCNPMDLPMRVELSSYMRQNTGSSQLQRAMEQVRVHCASQVHKQTQAVSQLSKPSSDPPGLLNLDESSRQADRELAGLVESVLIMSKQNKQMQDSGRRSDMMVQAATQELQTLRNQRTQEIQQQQQQQKQVAAVGVQSQGQATFPPFPQAATDAAATAVATTTLANRIAAMITQQHVASGRAQIASNATAAHWQQEVINQALLQQKLRPSSAVRQGRMQPTFSSQVPVEEGSTLMPPAQQMLSPATPQLGAEWAVPAFGGGQYANALPVPPANEGMPPLCRALASATAAERKVAEYTLPSILRELATFDADRILVARKINRLGFNSDKHLEAHFGKYGRVDHVFVAHSNGKNSKDGRSRLRKSGFGFVVMSTVGEALASLAAGADQVVDGIALPGAADLLIQVHCFRRSGSTELGEQEQ